jgi:hypothetical protein
MQQSFSPRAPQQMQLAPMQRPFAPGVLQQTPRVSSLQYSSAPAVPQRQDINDEDDGDDGGINPKIIAKQKQEIEKKKKAKEEMKKKKQLDDDDDDDDGGINPKIIAKQKQELEKKKNKNKSKTPLFLDDDEDVDGGISKQKILAAEKKKQELEAKKKKKEQMKAKAKQDNDDDDDGAPKRQEPIKKKKPTEKISKSEILKEEDEDDDGGRIVKTYDTIRKIIPNKQPVLDHSTKKSPSPEAADDGSMSTSKHQQEPLLKSYDTVGRMVPKISTDYRRIKEENPYDRIPTDEERAARSQAVYSPPSYGKATNSNDLYLLRTISYREAQQSTPPLIERRPTGSLSLRSHSNTNEDSSHYSEITNDTVSSGVINRSYSHTGSIQSASNHSIKLQNKEPSQQTLKEEQHTEESTIETEEEDEDDEEDEEEEEEEEEEKKEQSKDKPLKLKPLPNVSTAFQTISHMVKPGGVPGIDEIIKKKRARFRWFLAYTILNNYHLFDLRKQVQSRLARLRIERSNLIDEERHATAAAAADAVADQQPISKAGISTSPGIRQRNLKYIYSNKFYY